MVFSVFLLANSEASGLHSRDEPVEQRDKRLDTATTSGREGSMNAQHMRT